MVSVADIASTQIVNMRVCSLTADVVFVWFLTATRMSYFVMSVVPKWNLYVHPNIRACYDFV